MTAVTMPSTPAATPGAAAFGAWSADAGAGTGAWNLDTGKPVGADRADFAPLLDLRRSAERLFAAIEAQLAETSQRATEAEDLRVQAERSQEAWEEERAATRAALETERRRLREERAALEAEKAEMVAPNAKKSDVLSLNVGGERIIQRRRSTLCAVKDSFLAARFSGRWEQDLDRDEEGRYFINYAPELFLPLLDYLSLKETEDPSKEVRLPTGPENQTQQFQAMLKYYGLLPVVSVLDAAQIDYQDVVSSDHGIAFEIVPKTSSLLLCALEACAGQSVTTAATATVYTCKGTLLRRLRQRDEWAQVATGTLRPGRRSRIEFAEPVLLEAKTSSCVYIATNNPNGVAFGEEARGGEVCAENDDVAVHAGRTSGSTAHFAGFEGFIYWYAFNGKLEYTLADGL